MLLPCDILAETAAMKRYAAMAKRDFPEFRRGYEAAAAHIENWVATAVGMPWTRGGQDGDRLT